jgi:hypothetical protein
MWNLKKQSQNGSAKGTQEDALWGQFKYRAGVCGLFIASVVTLPPLLRQIGILGPITFSLARK